MKKYPKTITITRNDLSRALKQPWNCRTCLIAQTAIRVFPEIKESQIDEIIELIIRASNNAEQAMILFDRAHGARRATNLFPKLEAMLPIKVKL